MQSKIRVVLGIVLGGIALAVCAVPASAAIVCSGNVCWHTHERYVYPPEAKVVVHEDDWKWGPEVKIREHEGRGYWRGDAWIEVK